MKSRPSLATGQFDAIGRARPLTEEQIHRAVVRQIQIRATGGTEWWHTPNGDLRKPGVAGRLKAMGTRAGMPDLMFLKDGQFYALELKRIGGRESDHQRQRMSALAAAGGICATVQGLDAALTVLEQWGILRRDAGRVAR